MKKLNVFNKNFYCPLKSRYFFGNLIHNIKITFKNIKYSWQRITKGYCDRDLWGLDWFYTNLFIDSLTDFTKNLYGAPDEFFDHENDSIQPWVDKILEVRDLFELTLEETTREEDQQKLIKAMTEFTKIFPNLWD